MAFKAWEDLTISDDYLFKRIMLQEEICQQFLEMLLGVNIREIRYLDSEKSIKPGYASKAVRLDVYVEDEKNTVYDVEMQVAPLGSHTLERRTRYYQSMLDADLLAAGADYDALNQSIIIFVCQFDPFGRGRHIYTFANRCEEEPGLLLGDGASKIFLNTQGTAEDVSEDLRAFLAYINGKLTGNPFVQLVDAAIRKLKTKEQERLNYMTWEIKLDEMRKRGLAEGRAQGLEEGRLEGQAEGRKEGMKEGMKEGIKKTARIVRTLLTRKMSYEEIAAYEGTSIDEVRRIAEEAGIAY